MAFRSQERSGSPDSETISITSTAASEIRDNYQVENILDEMIDDDGETLYLVEWEGYPVTRATWEPASSFINPEDLFRRWDEDQRRIRSGAAQRFDNTQWAADIAEIEEARAKRKAARERKRRRLASRNSAFARPRPASTPNAPPVARSQGDKGNEKQKKKRRSTLNQSSGQEEQSITQSKPKEKTKQGKDVRVTQNSTQSPQPPVPQRRVSIFDNAGSQLESTRTGRQARVGRNTTQAPDQGSARTGTGQSPQSMQTLGASRRHADRAEPSTSTRVFAEGPSDATIPEPLAPPAAPGSARKPRAVAPSRAAVAGRGPAKAKRIAKLERITKEHIAQEKKAAEKPMTNVLANWTKIPKPRNLTKPPPRGAPPAEDPKLFKHLSQTRRFEKAGRLEKPPDLASLRYLYALDGSQRIVDAAPRAAEPAVLAVESRWASAERGQMNTPRAAEPAVPAVESRWASAERREMNTQQNEPNTGRRSADNALVDHHRQNILGGQARDTNLGTDDNEAAIRRASSPGIIPSQQQRAGSSPEVHPVRRTYKRKLTLREYSARGARGNNTGTAVSPPPVSTTPSGATATPEQSATRVDQTTDPERGSESSWPGWLPLTYETVVHEVGPGLVQLLEVTGYKHLLPDPVDGSLPTGDFFLFCHEDKEEAADTLRKFLLESGASRVVQDVGPEWNGRAWAEWCETLENGTLLIDPDMETVIHFLPRLGDLLMRKPVEVFMLGIEAEPTIRTFTSLQDNQIDEDGPGVIRFEQGYQCTRLFHQGGCILITDRLILQDPMAASKIVCWFEHWRHLQPAMTWRLVGRHSLPAFVEGLFNAKEPGDPALDPLVKMWCALSRIWDSRTWPPIDHPLRSLDGPYEGHDDDRFAPIIGKKIPGYFEDPCGPDQMLTDWFAGWAMINADRYREFVVVDPGDRGQGGRMVNVEAWGHLRAVTPEEFMKDFGVEDGD